MIGVSSLSGGRPAYGACATSVDAAPAGARPQVARSVQAVLRKCGDGGSVGEVSRGGGVNNDVVALHVQFPAADDRDLVRNVRIGLVRKNERLAVVDEDEGVNRIGAQ